MADKKSKRFRRDTDVSLGDPTKSNIRAVFNNGIARATEIDINVFAVMHTKLAA
jgi:hypothetical protein